MTFVTAANFVITSIRSAQKSADCVFISLTVPFYSLGKHTLWIFVRMASPRSFNKYTKRMICEKKTLFKSTRYSCFRRIPIKFLYNSEFDFTAKPLVTNIVVITRVLCILALLLFLNAEEPYTKLVPFFEPISKCMQFVNQEAGEKRRQHYCEALTKESLNKYYPPMQEVLNMNFTYIIILSQVVESFVNLT